MPDDNTQVAELEGHVTDLEAQVTDLTKRLANATGTDDKVKKVDELTTQVNTLTAQVAELKTNADTATAALAEAQEVDKRKDEMDEDEREYFRSLSREDRDKFLKLDAAGRKKAAKVRKAEDETVTIGGRVIRKSAVGDDTFAVMKAQADEIAANKAEIEKERGQRETVELKKRADDEFSHVIGTTDERAEVLKAVSKLDEPVRKSLEAVLGQAEKLAKAGFARVGGTGAGNLEDETVQKAAADFNGKVSEILKRDNKGRTEALRKARTEFPKLYEAYQASQTKGN